MGRSKSLPTKKRSSDEESLLLGRTSLNDNVSIDLMVAAEVEEDRAAQQHQHVLLHHQREQERGPPSAPPPRLAALLEQIEREHDAAANIKRKRPPKRKKAKSVRFVEETTIIPDPEIQIRLDDDADGSTTLVVAHPSSTEPLSTTTFHELATVWKSNVRLVVDEAPMRISTFASALDLCRLFLPHQQNYSSAAQQAIARLVQRDRLAMQLVVLTNDDKEGVGLRFGISDVAIQEANGIGISSRRRLQNSDLKLAMKALFPESIISDTPTTPNNIVTARQVYQLVDNVGILNAKEAPPLEIQGLVPTLRGYQDAAVRWMLQREHETTTTDNEWVLAWVNLQQSSSAATITSLKDSGLLYCPFTGWFATSYQHARALTVSSKNSSVRGGILAEAPGLGKTVEVIACVLANRYTPTQQQSTSARRRLDFDAHDEQEPIPTSVATTDADNAKIGYVGDLTEFGDVESDDDEEPRTTSAAPVPVTPEKTVEKSVQERWVEDDIIGACICGELIGFGIKVGDFVVCRSCEEPMHVQCAAFSSLHKMERETTRLRYRQEFTNRSLDCRLCKESSQCPCCIETQQSGATLIVTPLAILSQWEREIQRHARDSNGQPLKVVVYDGVKRLTAEKKGIQFLHPIQLATADVVLTTFNVLMSDLGHSDDNRYIQRSDDFEASNLRKRKRYRVVPSPLLSIEFWRVCLDEAQRVEAPTAGSAQMALKLKTRHRWAVSGTPIGRGKLEDLYGLLLFLGVEPFQNKTWFRKSFKPAGNVDERISRLLRDVFWRSTKACDLVREQMGVPDQFEQKVLLKFSSIERHFYDCQLEKTMSAAGAVAENKKRKATSLHLLAEHLHSLRAACCHPQVGSSGIAPLSRTKASRCDASVSSRVLPMRQILEKLIDDAKIQCEEAQRLAVMHTNAMAALSRLKVEAKQRDISIAETDNALMAKSCELYMESLRLADENAAPVPIIAEATLSGSVGFRSAGAIVQSGLFRMDWRWSRSSPSVPWCKVDFALGRKVTQLKVRALTEIPRDIAEETSDHFSWNIVLPKDCDIQCLSASGEFTTVHSFTLSAPEDRIDVWAVESGFRTNKSKSWRIVVKTVHGDHDTNDDSQSSGVYLGIEVELHEASIASDPLQRLHCLHNASISFSSLIQIQNGDDLADDGRLGLSVEELRQKMAEMNAEAGKIESLYLDAAKAVHNDNRRRLCEASKTRSDHEGDLRRLTESTKPRGSLSDCWDDMWWDDFLVLCHLHGTEEQKRHLCERLLQDLDGVLQGGLSGTDRTGLVPFPQFGDIAGLRTALSMRMRDIRTGLGRKAPRQSNVSDESGALGKEKGFPMPRPGMFRCPKGAHARCMHSILDLSSNPTTAEILENSHCKVCKADWFQTGPQCRHCKIGEELEDLSPDRVTTLVLNSLYSLVRSHFGKSLLKSAKDAHVEQRAKTFFELVEAVKREKVAAWRFWRTHLDLLNDIDELNQCKTAMRLSFEGEDVTQLTEDQLNAVVVLIDVGAKFHDHAAKQAMALGTLSRGRETLQFLKNQSAEENDDGNTDSNDCIICLSPFGAANRAVLRCGHRICLSPCLEQMRKKSDMIRCPLRCRVRTDPKDVLIASEQRRDDGSLTKREIKGSYGTKVTRLVSDILDICDAGDKSLVFSQWEDMLDICSQALTENNVSFVRVASARKIGECTRRFRSAECSVMLLNVRNGAEGLTLLEATNVFMIEPLLNCGLDNQAINRIHRIGQNRKTYVWRYLVEDTVEIKIDKLRMEHQEDQLEDLISEGRKSVIQAGGIDGGFQSHEELLDILRS